MTADTPLRLFATCAPGLESLLADEVETALGASGVEPVRGGVEWAGTRTQLHRACLRLGLAMRIRIRMTDAIVVKRFDALAAHAAAVPWPEWVDPRTPLQVRAHARASRLYHEKAIVERVHRGITQALGREPETGADAPDTPVQVHVRIAHDRCSLSLDVTGASLSRRGYRVETAKAPLREDLARALVVVSGWDRTTPFVDPLMGSGTLPIEAALLARGLPPGAGRRFALMDTPLFDAGTWADEHERALARARAEAPPIRGSDRDAGAVRAAHTNAEQAGVSADVHFAQAPLSAAPGLDGPLPLAGALVTNPPHGRRVRGRPDLRPLYQSLGRIARGLPEGWRVALLAADRRLALKTGLALQTAILTDHGGTKVRMLVAGGVD